MARLSPDVVNVVVWIASRRTSGRVPSEIGATLGERSEARGNRRRAALAAWGSGIVLDGERFFLGDEAKLFALLGFLFALNRDAEIERFH